jgi:glutamine amidotransferase
VRMQNIVIVDYGLGNLASIKNMLKAIGTSSFITSDIAEINQADKLILAGVGAFDKAMQNLEELNLLQVLNDLVLTRKIPVLGICLGMQLFTETSEEGKKKGLGWIKGKTIKFSFDTTGSNRKIPHMGWNTITIKRDNMLFHGLDNDARFYFVHSYYVTCEDQADVLASTFYGIDFTSALQKDNIYGVQFHPEKSHRFGKSLLEKFTEI